MTEWLLLDRPGETDPELAAEDRARRDAVERVAAAGTVWSLQDRLWARRGDETRPVATLLAEGAIPYGPLPTVGSHGSLPEWTPAYETLAGRYADLDAFHRHAGRATEVVDTSSDETGDLLGEAVQRIGGTGCALVVVKSTRPKTGLWNLLLPPMPRRDLRDLHPPAGEYDHLSGFLVQEYREMQYETRFFVVGHRVVTGAGCVEELTPQDGRGYETDTRVRRWRRADQPVVDRPRRVEEMRRFAIRVAADIAAERPAMPHYVLDVAYDPLAGRPLVVELNGLHNAGLYASQPWRVVEALLAWSWSGR